MIEFLRKIINGGDVIRDAPEKPLLAPSVKEEESLTVDNLVIPEYVSPPVSNIVRLYLRNPGRFEISFKNLVTGKHAHVSVRDKKTDLKVKFQFCVRYSYDTTKHGRFHVYSRPGWITQDEADWVIDTLYDFTDRRDSKLKALRIERGKRANKSTRLRVIEMYKDE